MTVILREGNKVVIDRMVINGGIYTHGGYTDECKPVLYSSEHDLYYTSVTNNAFKPKEETLSVIAALGKEHFKGTVETIDAPEETILDYMDATCYAFFFRDFTLRVYDGKYFKVNPANDRHAVNAFPETIAFVGEYCGHLGLLEHHSKLVEYTKYASNGGQEFGDVTLLAFGENDNV